MADALHPEVVLLDLGMATMNGYEVCRQIRAQAWGRDIVLVAQTGWGQDDDRARTRAAGFDIHLTKPLEASVLAEVIRQRATSA